MSAVSKKVMPASSAASTTLALASASIRMPKLLQPTPTSDTRSDPIERVSISSGLDSRTVAWRVAPHPIRRAIRVLDPVTGGHGRRRVVFQVIGEHPHQFRIHAAGAGVSM